MNSLPDIVVSRDPEQMSRRAAAAIRDLIGRAIADRGVSFVALAGGETPLRVYQLLAAEPGPNPIDWRHVHLFFGDERMVPPEDPASNYGMVFRELVSRVPIPPEHVHRIRGEASAMVAGREYEAELRKWFDGPVPRFDIVVLGIGEDGHTASLFPGTEPLNEASRTAMGYFVPQLNSWRVTLTLPVLVNARETLFLVTGRRKASVVARILESEESGPNLPASMVRPTQGNVRWMLDEDSASLLSRAPDSA